MVFSVTPTHFAISGIVKIPEAAKGMAVGPMGWSAQKSRIGKNCRKMNRTGGVKPASG